jgi:hypothetical protein
MPLNSHETLMIDELRLHLRLELRSELPVLFTRCGRPDGRAHGWRGSGDEPVVWCHP